MSRSTIDNLKCGTLLAVLFALALFASGCPSHNASPDISATGTHIAKADAYVEGAIPHTDSNGKPLLNSARVELSAADKSNQAAAVENAALVKDRDQWKAKFEQLDNSLPVVIWRWIRRLLWALVITGIASWFAYNFLGGVWGGVLSRIGGFVLSLFHLLPAPNPFPAANATVAYFRGRKGASA